MDKSMIRYLNTKVFEGQPGFLKKVQAQVLNLMGPHGYLVLDGNFSNLLTIRFPIKTRLFKRNRLLKINLRE